jgi:uncharacterized UPF0160 family protein
MNTFSTIKKMTSNNKIKLITHSGSFHADDVFACATLSLLLENKKQDFEVIRTRDMDVIKTGDYVFDVGCIYDADTNRFDHHQPGGAGKRDNGIEYSSFGLVWKKFGQELCGSKESWERIERRLCQPIDAGDNGQKISEAVYENVFPYELHNTISIFLPTWKETDIDRDVVFLDLVSQAKKILSREIVLASHFEEGKGKVIEAYNNAQDKRVVVLDEHYSWKDILINFPEPLYVVSEREDGTWSVHAVLAEPHSFKNRKDLPKSWAGLVNEEFAKVTGVEDVVFCHRSLFLAVARTKEGAIKLAELAINS